MRQNPPASVPSRNPNPEPQGGVVAWQRPHSHPPPTWLGAFPRRSIYSARTTFPRRPRRLNQPQLFFSPETASSSSSSPYDTLLLFFLFLTFSPGGLNRFFNTRLCVGLHARGLEGHSSARAHGICVALLLHFTPGLPLLPIRAVECGPPYSSFPGLPIESLPYTPITPPPRASIVPTANIKTTQVPSSPSFFPHP